MWNLWDRRLLSRLAVLHMYVISVYKKGSSISPSSENSNVIKGFVYLCINKFEFSFANVYNNLSIIYKNYKSTKAFFHHRRFKEYM